MSLCNKLGVLFICVIIYLAFSSSSSFAETDNADELAAKVQTRLAAINDINGTFTQSSYIKDLEETRQFAGKFFIKKPHYIMWEYDPPRDEKIVMQKDTTWIYKKSQHRAIKSRFNKEAYSQVPIAMLTSLEKLKDDYDITMPEKNVLHLVPKRNIGSIHMLVIETAAGDFPIKTLTIFDTYGNIVIIELSEVKINTKPDDSLFIFKAPPGTEVYDMSQ